ncbi:MAG: NAD(P)H-dependent oxidoreductase subunit E [Bacteroidales bacterium]
MYSNIVDHKIHIRENKPFIFREEILEKAQKIISRYPEGEHKSALIPLLHITQEENGGYLSVEAMDALADLLKIQPIEVYEVATFYTQFYLEKQGKFVIEVCQTASCAICGGEEIIEHLEKKLGIKTGETTHDGLFSLKSVECLGGCGWAPVLQVNTEFHENLDIEKVDRLIDDLKQKSKDEPAKTLSWAERFC